MLSRGHRTTESSTTRSEPHARSDAFRAPFGLAGPHAQSLLAGWPVRQWWLRRLAGPLLGASRPEILDGGDGIRLLGLHTPARARNRGLAIMLHGWEGSAEASYVLSVATRLHAAGFEVLRLNFRDHGDTYALNRDLFHSCRIDEVVRAIGSAVAAHAAPRTVLIGHSLGGNFALRVAVRAPAAGIALDKVVAICPVLRPHSTMRALEDGLWIYREYFLRRWRKSLLAKAACFPELYDFGDLRRFPTLTATTDFFVKRYTSFPDLDAYLNGYAVTGNALAELTVATRVIASADDPVIPVKDIDDLAAAPALGIEVLPRGGHCGFLESYRLRSWLDDAVLREVDP